MIESKQKVLQVFKNCSWKKYQPSDTEFYDFIKLSSDLKVEDIATEFFDD